MRFLSVVFLAVLVCTMAVTTVSSHRLSVQERQQQCYIDLIADAAKSNGMSDEWSKAEPEIRGRLGVWMEHIKANGFFGAVYYFVKRGRIINRVVSGFMRSILDHPNHARFINDVDRTIKEKIC